ncbi:MAG TPA: MarR family transcriptional regulator [Polyangiaceae bacterium]|jgi:DNA-binding MarR family transcriptional regulator
MNAIFFGCKRAFHSCMRIARQVLAGLGLTPARFDMLTAVGENRAFGCAQRELRSLLGVSAATISRMLASLEDIGLVTRTKNEYPDRRQRRVALSAAGLKCLRKATRHLVRSGAIQLAVDSALTNNRAHDESRCLVEMDLAESILRRLRDAFGDIATLQYPWHPDD